MSEVIELAAALPTVDADFHDVLRALSPPLTVRLVLLDDVPDPEVGRLLKDRTEWRSDQPQDLLLLIGSSATALDTALSAPEPLGVEVASLLQDHVMNALNTPWPLIAQADGMPVVAEPMLVQGRAVWASRGKPMAAVGDLCPVE